MILPQRDSPEIEVVDHLKIVIPQAVLMVASKRSCEECPFRLDEPEFPDETVQNRLPLAHPREALGEQSVKIPVDEIVFVQKMPVERLSGDATLPADLSDRDVFERGRSYAVPQGDCKTQLHGFARGRIWRNAVLLTPHERFSSGSGFL